MTADDAILALYHEGEPLTAAQDARLSKIMAEAMAENLAKPDSQVGNAPETEMITPTRFTTSIDKLAEFYAVEIPEGMSDETIVIECDDDGWTACGLDCDFHGDGWEPRNDAHAADIFAEIGHE